jgi:hypothetical protein
MNSFSLRRLLYTLTLLLFAALQSTVSAYPDGVDVDTQLINIPRDHGLVYSYTNPTSGTLNVTVFNRANNEIMWATSVDATSTTQGLVKLQPGNVEIHFDYYDLSKYIYQTRIYSDMDRPLTPEMQLVIQAIQIASPTEFISRVRTSFLNNPSIPQALRPPYTALLIKSTVLLSQKTSSPEQFVRRSLQDLRGYRADVLEEQSAVIPLQIRVLYLLTFYEVARQITSERISELQTIYNNSPETVDLMFVATFEEDTE